MSRPRLLVVDAPGGPHPSLYLPSLLGEFEVHCVWLDVEQPAPRQRRAAALAAVTEAGGRLTTASSPQQLPALLSTLIRECAPQGVIAFSERVVHIAQRAAFAAGLPGNAPDVLDALQDKRLQRARLRAAGLPTPAQCELREATDVRDAAARMPFPAVLKPSSGMGSLATFRITTAEELAPAWQHARELVARDGRVAYLEPVMLLEEELVGDPESCHSGLGDYLSVEGLVVAGELEVIAVSDKLPLSYPYRENGHILPALRSAAECAAAIEQTRQAHAALGIRFGATHTEVKLTPAGPRVIEINGRVGGSVPEQLKLAAGYDLPLNLARLSVGARPELVAHCTAWSAYLTPQPPVGSYRIEAAPTLDQLQAMDGVRTVHELHVPGDRIDSATGTASNLLRVVTVHPSTQELFELADAVSAAQAFVLTPSDTDADRRDRRG